MERLTASVPPEPAALPDVSAEPRAGDGARLLPRDTADLREIVRQAIDQKARLRIVGRGTWLDAGRPVRDAQVVSLERLTGVVDYTPGDLTLTAGAATTLAEIAEATAANGQWLALAPWGGDAGSLGATAATATAGPTSGALGAPRDTVIGLEAVTGTGEAVRGGGRVVKNVAGFDLTRLMVGAWGTIGILTQVSVRLRGVPEREATVAMPAPNAGPGLTDVLTRLRSAAIAPLALEIVSAGLAARLGLGAQSTIITRVAGNADAVEAQRTALAGCGDVVDAPPDVWRSLRTADLPGASVLRLSGPVARFAETWLAANRLATVGDGHAHGSILRSTTRVVVPNVNGSLPDAVLDLLRAPARDVRIFERLPAALWPSLAPTAVADRLSRGIRRAFDPHGLLNPGILGEDLA